MGSAPDAGERLESELGAGLKRVGTPPSASQAEVGEQEALWWGSQGLEEGKR